MSKISLQSTVGKGYYDFWNTKKTYVVCKGSRGSKKSKTAALWHIYHMMKYPLANTLVVRKVGMTLRDSAYSDLLWAAEKLGVAHLWRGTTSPLELTYTPTGQKILFRGLDSPFKITSISVPCGVLNFLWVEEAYEILKEDDFNTLDESIRGKLPDGYFKRVTVTFNPWSEMHWLKSRFFDFPLDNVLALTTTYRCNEWLSDADRKMYEDIRRRSPARARVACDGEWGIAEGLIFDNWRVEDLTEKIPAFDNIYNGLDFGYSSDYTALIRAHLDKAKKIIYVFDEYYALRLLTRQLVPVLEEKCGGQYVMCDSASPERIAELAMNGIRAIGVKKTEINFGIAWLLGYDIVIHKDCVNFVREISSYRWEEDKFGNALPKPLGVDDHGLDALRYAFNVVMLQGEAQAGVRL